MLKPNSFETRKKDELEEPIPIQVGVRIFKVGPWDEKAASNMKSALFRVVTMAEDAKKEGVELVIISNADIAPEGRGLLEQIGARGIVVLYTSRQKAVRRAELARVLVKGAAPPGTYSYADMLGELTTNNGATPIVGFMSSDLVTPEGLKNMKAAKWVYETLGGPNCYMVGVAVQKVHDINAVKQVIKGEVSIDFSILWRMFPNNAFSLVARGTQFAGIMDNGIAGQIELPGGKIVKVGGNEEYIEFLNESIITWNPRISPQPPYVILVVDPNMVRDLTAEWPAHEEKYARRRIIYENFMRRNLCLAWRRQTGVFAKGGDLHGLRYDEVFDENGNPYPQIVNELMSRRLFFARVSNETPELIPTKRQKEIYGWK